MPVVGNVNGLAILPGSRLLDVDVLLREHAELRSALRSLVAATDFAIDPESRRVRESVAKADNLLCAITEREDSEA